MITLRIRVRVGPGRGREFEAMYRDVFAPALSVQRGFRGCSLLRAYDERRSAEGGLSRVWDYEVGLAFDSEEHRRAWVASPEHAAAWPRFEALCAGVEGQGYDVLTTVGG